MAAENGRLPDHPIIGLVSLIEACKRQPFENWDAELSPEKAFAGTLKDLAKLKLDVEAATALLSAVIYLSGKEMRDAWQNLWQQLKIENTRDLAVFTLPRENHFDSLIRMNGLPDRRNSDIWTVSTPEELWNLVDASESGVLSTEHRERLLAMDRRETWILLWDQLLSGTHVASGLKRLRWLQSTMPSRVPRRLLLGAAFGAVAPLEMLRREFPEIEIIVGLALSDHHGWEKYEIVQSSIGDRVEEFCKEFFNIVIEPVLKVSPNQYPNLAPLGYKNGGFLLVTSANCPNNSLPFLWFSASSNYRPPFPRVESKSSSRSSSPELLIQLSLSGSKIPHYLASNALAMGLGPLDCVPLAAEGRPLEIWLKSLQDMIRRVSSADVAKAKDLLKQAQLIQEWLPTDGPQIELLRVAALAVESYALLRSGSLVEAKGVYNKLQNSTTGYRPDLRHHSADDDLVAGFEQQLLRELVQAGALCENPADLGSQKIAALTSDGGLSTAPSFNHSHVRLVREFVDEAKKFPNSRLFINLVGPLGSEFEEVRAEISQRLNLPSIVLDLYPTMSPEKVRNSLGRELRLAAPNATSLMNAPQLATCVLGLDRVLAATTISDHRSNDLLVELVDEIRAIQLELLHSRHILIIETLVPYSHLQKAADGRVHSGSALRSSYASESAFADWDRWTLDEARRLAQASVTAELRELAEGNPRLFRLALSCSLAEKRAEILLDAGREIAEDAWLRLPQCCRTAFFLFMKDGKGAESCLRAMRAGRLLEKREGKYLVLSEALAKLGMGETIW